MFKTIIALATMAVVASAEREEIQFWPTDQWSFGVPARVAAVGTLPLPGVTAQCFPEKLQTCQAHFSLYPNINCEGICGLCDLCGAAKGTDSVSPPGCEYCAKGAEACTATCNAGRTLCAQCGIVY